MKIFVQHHNLTCSVMRVGSLLIYQIILITVSEIQSRKQCFWKSHDKVLTFLLFLSRTVFFFVKKQFICVSIIDRKFSMASVNVIFTTPTCFNFKQLDNFEILKKQQIKRFIIIFIIALFAFFVELADRRNPEDDALFENCIRKLQKTAQNINEHGLLITNVEYISSILDLLFSSAR